MLWSFEPVKCWSRFPKHSGRDDAQVEAEAVVRDDGRLRRAVRGDLGDALVLHERLDQRRRVGGGRDQVDVARGLGAAANAARPRRRGRRPGARPARRPSPARPAGRDRAGSGPSPATPWAWRAPPAPAPRSSGPRPESSRSFCASAAARSSSRFETPSSSHSRRAVFGPRPGTCMTSTSPAGTLSRSFASAFRSPVSTYSTIFAAMVEPIPGISVDRAVERELRNRRRRTR